MGGWKGKRGEGRGGNKNGGYRKGPQKLVHTRNVRNPEKYPDCRTDLIGGAATQTFALGGKHPRAATGVEAASS